MFMNAITDIPETRSCRIHQGGSADYPQFYKCYHFTLSFQDFRTTTKTSTERYYIRRSSLILRHVSMLVPRGTLGK